MALLFFFGGGFYAGEFAQGQAAPGSAPPELVLQISHIGEVKKVVFSPDSRLLASVSADRTLKLWDGKTGVLRYSLTGHTDITQAVAFSPDNRTVYSIGRDGVPRIWDTQTGALLGTITGLKPGATASALWCGGNGGTTLLLAAAYPDKTLFLWKAKGGQAGAAEVVSELAGHTSEIGALAFSRDGLLLASGDNNGSLKIWDTEDGALQRTRRGHAMPIRDVAFSADGKVLADACDDGNTNRWDVKTGMELGELQLGRPGEGEGAVAFAPDGQTIAIGGYGIDPTENLKLWNAQTGKETRILKGHQGFVSAAAFSPDGRLLATGGKDTTIRLWEIPSGKEVGLRGRREYIASLAFSPQGDILASGSANGLVRLWNARTGELKQTLSGHTDSALAVAFSPDGKTLVSGGKDRRARLWDAQTGALKLTLPETRASINALTFSPDGVRVAAGCGEGRIQGSVTIWEVASGKQLQFLDGNSLERVYGLAYSPDGTLLATASEFNGRGEMRLWETATGKLLKTEFTPGLRSVAFNADGKSLVFGGGTVDEQKEFTGEELIFWNGRTQEMQRTVKIPAAGGRANTLAFLPDKQTLVIGSADGRLFLWNSRTDTIKRTLLEKSGALLSVAVSADGKMLASAGADNAIRLWSLVREKPLATLIPLPAPVSALPEVAGAAPLETDWLTVTPEGYYDGSPGAARRIQWRVERNLFPVESFERVLRRPEQVKRILLRDTLPPRPPSNEGPLQTQPSNPGPPIPAVTLALIPPQISFQTPKEGQSLSGERVKVQFVVTAPRKVAQVEILTNGRPVGAKPLQQDAKPLGQDAKPLGQDAKPLPPGHKILQEFQMEVALPPGETQVALTALATDDQGLQAREEIRLTRADANAAPGNLYVLVIGVSKYQNAKYNLKYAAADADAFGALWEKQRGALYQKVEVTRLTDGQATSANIRAALLKLLETATERDSVAIFLSGHGVQATETEYYFASHDIDVSRVEQTRATGLPWTAFQTTLAALHARRVFLFLDACHSGNALGGQQSSNERMAELLVKRAGVMVFASSRGNEYSYELEMLKHGAFTAALIEALSENKADLEIGGQKDGVITAEELLAYLRARVPQMTGNLQTPTCPLLRDFGEAFPLARTR